MDDRDFVITEMEKQASKYNGLSADWFNKDGTEEKYFPPTGYSFEISGQKFSYFFGGKKIRGKSMSKSNQFFVTTNGRCIAKISIGRSQFGRQHMAKAINAIAEALRDRKAQAA